MSVRGCTQPHSAEKGSLAGRNSCAPSNTPAIRGKALWMEGSFPKLLCKGETTRKGNVVQRPGCRAMYNRLGKQHPDCPACRVCLPLCLFQLSCGRGPILAQVLLDILCLVPPSCASLLRPLQHNVISSLGAAQLRGLCLALGEEGIS